MELYTARAHPVLFPSREMHVTLSLYPSHLFPAMRYGSAKKTKK
jgi:hypothetical protein